MTRRYNNLAPVSLFVFSYRYAVKIGDMTFESAAKSKKKEARAYAALAALNQIESNPIYSGIRKVSWNELKSFLISLYLYIYIYKF